MSDAQPPADRLSAYLKRLLPSPGSARAPDEPASAKAQRIRVRRFAGPAAYVERIAPVRIAHLTDLHVGRITPMAVQRAAVELTNAEKPDLVVITGDFVCHSLLYLDQLEEVVRGFEAPVIGVLGNHDHWSSADDVKRALERGGALVLQNQSTTVELGHERLQVVGLDDAYTGHARRDDAVKGLRADLPALGLSHIAEEADGLWEHDVPLVLSGHTHGGLVTVARMHEIAFGRITGHRYVHGLYGSRAGDAPGGAVYVGAGIGASVVPLRLGDRAKREVAIFELGARPGSFDEDHGEKAPLKGRRPSERTAARRAEAVVKKRQARERKAARGN